MLRKCQSSGNVDWLCGESVEEFLVFFFKYAVLNKLGEFSTGGPPCRTSKNIWHIGLQPSAGAGGGDIFTSPITRLKIFQNPFLGEPGGGGGGGGGGERWGTACILGDVQIANSNKSLKHEVFLNLVSDKMRVPCLGPFTDQNGRFLYVYFELL